MPNEMQQRRTASCSSCRTETASFDLNERQLRVLTDFWFNHFNVDARKGRDRFMLTEYERDAIRPHVLGTFRDLLEATAKSPAMLFYLDNWMSADPAGPHADMSQPLAGGGPVRRGRFGGGGFGFPVRRRVRTRSGKEGARAQRENYGRELMELPHAGRRRRLHAERRHRGRAVPSPAGRFRTRDGARGVQVRASHS
jgi:hypothetical protein